MTDIQIINAALISVGCNPITSVEDNSNEAKTAKWLYPTCRDTVLEDRQWTFAMARMELALNAYPPNSSVYKYAYDIPPEIITVVRALDANDDTLDTWVREGMQVWTDQEPSVFVEYIRRVPEGNFSPGFTNALIAKLAAEFAGPLTENRNLAADWQQKYEHRVAKAGANDGLQGRSQLKTTPFIPGRRKVIK